MQRNSENSEKYKKNIRKCSKNQLASAVGCFTQQKVTKKCRKVQKNAEKFMNCKQIHKIQNR
jgi:hypothetical protein